MRNRVPLLASTGTATIWARRSSSRMSMGFGDTSTAARFASSAAKRGCMRPAMRTVHLPRSRCSAGSTLSMNHSRPTRLGCQSKLPLSSTVPVGADVARTPA
jgi:hypothetical protein